jgi:hypothetical protein
MRRLLTLFIIEWEKQSHILEEPLSMSWLASIKSCREMHDERQDSGTFWSAVEGYESLCQD